MLTTDKKYVTIIRRESSLWIGITQTLMLNKQWYINPPNPMQLASASCKRTHLVNEVILRQGQRLRRLRVAEHPVRLDDVALRINTHLGHDIIKLHVLLADIAAVPDSLDAFLEAVGLDDAVVDGGLGDPHNGGTWDEGLNLLVMVLMMERKKGGEGGGGAYAELPTHDNGLDGGDGTVGVALCSTR